MACLAAVSYDPAVAVSEPTSSLLALTAIDTTNLRVSFAVPANGAVLVRLRGTVHGATTFPQILLGVLEGATVRGRQTPMGALKATALATAQLTQEALFVVSGLTPAANVTWDAAYGVETLLASTGVKYGGPNNTTTNDAFGAFTFEVWETPTLLASATYDPASAAALSCASLLAMTAIDTTNLRLTFTVPASGKVLVRLRTTVESGTTTEPAILLGVLETATVKGRQSPIGGVLGTVLATTHVPQEASFVVSGLTPGASLTWDAAYGVEIIVTGSNIRHGGPNDATGDNAWGATSFEVWAA